MEYRDCTTPPSCFYISSRSRRRYPCNQNTRSAHVHSVRNALATVARVRNGTTICASKTCKSVSVSRLLSSFVWFSALSKIFLPNSTMISSVDSRYGSSLRLRRDWSKTRAGARRTRPPREQMSKPSFGVVYPTSSVDGGYRVHSRNTVSQEFRNLPDGLRAVAGLLHIAEKNRRHLRTIIQDLPFPPRPAR